MPQLIVVIDMQADFILADGALPVPDAEAIVEPIASWLAMRTPDDTAAVVFTFDTHFAETYPKSAEAAQFPVHCLKDTPGWRNMLDPLSIDAAIPCRTLEKGVFDMWAEPEIILHDPRGISPPVDRDTFFADLRSRGMDRAIVVGVAADYCVRWAIDGLVARGFAVTAPAAFTRGIARTIQTIVTDEFGGKPVTCL